MKLLTSNFRLEHGSHERGYMALGLSLAPNSLSGYNVCPSATTGCIEACNLWFSGRSVMGTARNAKISRTKLFYEDKEAFFKQLKKEIEAAQRKADKNGKKLAVRLNTASDIAWELIKVEEDKSVMELYPDIQFYDYTKMFKRALKHTHGDFPSNYHLTYSRSELNDPNCQIILESGGNVAFVFKNGLPELYNGFRVIDGD